MSSRRIAIASSFLSATIVLSLTALAQQPRSSSTRADKPLGRALPDAAGRTADAKEPARASGARTASQPAATRPKESTPSSDSARRTARRGEKGAAHVSIELVAPPEASVGIPADYVLVVRNEGESAVEYVRVEAELPNNAEFVAASPEAETEQGTAIWQLGKLESSGERRITMQLRPTDEGKIQCTAMVVCSSFSTIQTTITRPQLAMAISGPDSVEIGHTCSFVLKISNPGSGTATGVIVRNTLAAGLKHPAGSEIEYEIGSLAPGETREVELEVLADEAGAQANHAEVEANGGLRASAEASLDVLEPQLLVEKSGPKRRYLDRPATYSIVVSNPGTAPASNVVVTDELPDGTTLLEATDSGQPSADKKSVRWKIGKLEPGGTRTLSVTLRPTAPGEIYSQAVASADGDLKSKAETSTIVEGISALLVEVVDIDDPIEMGTETTYEVRVVNQGSQAATNVTLLAMAPRGMTPIKADGPARGEIRGQEIVFEPLPRLAARADTAFHIRVRGDLPGDHRFRVKLLCDQLDAPVNKEESTRVYSDDE